MFQKIALAVAVAFAGLAASSALPQSASAQDYGYGSGYTQDYHVCEYKTIKTYVYKRVSFQKRVTLYRSCGTPYYAWKTVWKTVKVPVYKRVRVCGCHH